MEIYFNLKNDLLPLYIFYSCLLFQVQVVNRGNKKNMKKGVVLLGFKAFMI